MRRLTIAVDAAQQDAFEEVLVVLHGAYRVPVGVVVRTVLVRTGGVGRHRLLRVVGEELEDDVQFRVVRSVVGRRVGVSVTTRLLLLLLTMLLTTSFHPDITRHSSLLDLYFLRLQLIRSARIKQLIFEYFRSYISWAA